MATWTVHHHPAVAAWLQGLTGPAAAAAAVVIDRLAHDGPSLARPFADSVKGSRHHNMKELRARTVRILFVFDPYREAVLLVAGDKRGEWNGWYRAAIKLADSRYDEWLDMLEGDHR